MLFIYFVKALFYLLYLFIDCFNIVEDFYIVMITKMYYINSILFWRYIKIIFFLFIYLF